MGDVLHDPQTREAELRALVAEIQRKISGCIGEKRDLYHVVLHLLCSEYSQPAQKNPFNSKSFRYIQDTDLALVSKLVNDDIMMDLSWSCSHKEVQAILKELLPWVLSQFTRR